MIKFKINYLFLLMQAIDAIFIILLGTHSQKTIHQQKYAESI